MMKPFLGTERRSLFVLDIPSDRALCTRLAERGYIGPEHAEDVDENRQTWVFGGWTEAGRKWLMEKLEARQ